MRDAAEHTTPDTIGKSLKQIIDYERRRGTEATNLPKTGAARIQPSHAAGTDEGRETHSGTAQ